MAGKRRVGAYWRKIGSNGVPQIVLLKPDGTNTPIGGDICKRTAGLMRFMSTGDTAIAALCADGTIGPDYSVDPMNNPGYVAGTSGKQGLAQIGGRGSRDATVATGKRLPFVVVDSGLQFLMEIKVGATANPAIGTSYGIIRDTAGEPVSRYVVDTDDTTNLCVTVVEFHQPDTDVGILPTTTPRCAVWVKAVNPGGSI